ncbi:MAG: metallophosphoesterase [Chloroflexota bacterium]|nr:MAG: metallophosphoesterase [Chloroflexota bacterium]
MTIKVLSLSDKQIESIYSPVVKDRFPDIDLILGCGDLTYSYLEFVVSMLDVPLYYVRGNHSHMIEYTASGPKTRPQGGTDIHRRVVNHHGLILAGIEGSLRYRRGPFQYSQFEMWKHVFAITPGLILNRIFSGRYLDIFISHAPPWGIHDKPDLPHQGIKSFRWLLDTFRPRYHFHGHIHLYRQYETTITQYKATTVINTYGYKETLLESLGD